MALRNLKCPGIFLAPCEGMPRPDSPVPSHGTCRRCGKQVARRMSGYLRAHKTGTSLLDVRIARLYAGGAGVLAVSGMEGVTRTAVYDALRRQGVELRDGQ